MIDAILSPEFIVTVIVIVFFMAWAGWWDKEGRA